MKAILMTAPGATNVLELHEVAKPTIQKPDQVLISIKAAGINPVDTKLRQKGTFYPEQMPAILGCDGAGIVEEIGSSVTKFKVGDPVYYCAGGLGEKNTGNYTQYAVVAAHRLAIKPSALSFVQAAAVPLALITAWESLYDRVKLAEGTKVLIHAGAGGVGHLAIQLAKLKGAQVATTVGTQDKARLALQLGADYPILYKQTDFVQAVLDWTDGLGVDIAFDTVGGQVFFDSAKAVKVYGDLVTILKPDPKIGDLEVPRNRNLRLSLELMLSPETLNLVEAQKHQAKILEEAAKLIDQDQLKIHLSQIYPLSQASIAHKFLEMGSVTGKIVLQIEES